MRIMSNEQVLTNDNDCVKLVTIVQSHNPKLNPGLTVVTNAAAHVHNFYTN